MGVRAGAGAPHVTACFGADPRFTLSSFLQLQPRMLTIDR